MNNSLSFSNKEFKINEKWLVFGLLGVYLILAVVWHFHTDAPWDDDCVGRYFNAKNAISDPQQFITLWNRPLFILLFFIPFQISKHAILLMACISAMSAYALYRAAKKLNISNAYLIVPMLLFQSFYFTISRSALSEPLAAAIISFGWLLYVNKKFLTFAIVGSLLPLARLELSLLLVIWAYILVVNKHWKYIFILCIPCVIWNFAGTLLEGDIFWLYNHTIGKDVVENRYGHTDFWHYFQRLIYVIGPVVFYFFFIGFFERLYRRKYDLFIIGQLILVFMIYVLFSWRLNLGQAAGFLRHLITISPLVSIVAFYGYNYWIQSIGFGKKSSLSPEHKKGSTDHEITLQGRIKAIQIQGKEKNLKSKKIRHLIAAEKRKYEEEKRKISRSDKEFNKKVKLTKFRILFYSLVSVVLSFLFFSKKLLFHHKISDIDDYTYVIILGALSIGFILLTLIFLNRSVGKVTKAFVGCSVIVLITGFTLITEPPDSHNSPERETMGYVSDLYVKSYLKNYDTYVNHSWFFWMNDIKPDREIYKLITQEDLDQAPDSSIIIWESHYSHRLAGNVKVEFFEDKPEYIQLFNQRSSDKDFTVVVFQKIKQSTPQEVLGIYNRFIKLEPNLPSAYVNRGNVILNKLGKYDQAILDYNKALALDSNYIDAYFNRGLAYFNLVQFNEAILNFTKTVQLMPDYYNAYFNIGASLSNLGDHSKAIENYSKTIELNSEYEPAYFNRALAYVNINEFDNAFGDFTKVITLNPQNFDAYYNRALTQLQSGKTDDLCPDLLKAQELGHPDARYLYQMYCE